MPMTPASAITMPRHCSLMRFSGIIVPMCAMTMEIIAPPTGPDAFATMSAGITPDHSSAM